MWASRYRDDGLVILLALACRLAFFFLQQAADPLFLQPIVDEVTYLEDARRWVAAGFSISGLNLPFWQPPAYTLILGCWLGGGGSAHGMLVVQSLLGVATSWLIFRTTLRAFGEPARRVALAGALFYSLCPATLYYEMKWLKPAWTLFLLALLLYLSYPREKNSPGWRRGLLVGLLALFDAYFIALLPLLLFTAGRRPARWLAPLLGCALPILAVFWLNAKETRTWVPFSYNGPVNLHVGNNPNWVKTYNSLPGWEWEQVTRHFDFTRAATGLDAAARGQLYTDEVKAYVIHQPVAFARGLMTKTLLFVSPRNLPRDGALMFFPVVRLLGWAGNVLLLTLAVLVFPRLRHDPLLAGTLILVALVDIVFFPTTRYRLTAIPVLLVAAGGLVPWSDLSARYRAMAWGTSLLLASTGAVTSARLVDYAAWTSFSYNEAAWRSLDQGQIARARQQTLQALQYRRLPSALNTAGQLIMGGGGDPSQAKVLFDEAIRTDPTLPSSYLNLGRLHQQRGDVAAACKEYDAFLDRLVPNQNGYSKHDAQGFAMSLEFTARAAFDRGQPVEALGRLRRIQEAQRQGWLAGVTTRGLDQQISQLENATSSR